MAEPIEILDGRDTLGGCPTPGNSRNDSVVFVRGLMKLEMEGFRPGR